MISDAVLPKPVQVVDKATGAESTKFFWAQGQTLFFGKDNTNDKLKQWHQGMLAGTICSWVQYWVFVNPYSRFVNAVEKLTSNWRAVLKVRKYAAMEKSMFLAQSPSRCILAF